MSVPAAYLGLILIWATTPLAIKWSSEGMGFIFALASRMWIGAVVCVFLLGLLSIELPRSRRALRAYLAVSLTHYGTLMLVYWGAQHVSSGLISVLFGISPLLTGLLAVRLLGEQRLNGARLLGIGLGMAGLAVVFLPAGEAIEARWYGVATVLLGVLLQVLSALWVKRLNVGLHPLSLNGGSLLVTALLLLATWGAVGAEVPLQWEPRGLGAIAYLGIFGSVLGFGLYFYLLSRVSAGAMSLITLMTPVLALLLGQGMNGEVVTERIWFGTATILLGLVCYQWGALLLARLGSALHPPLRSAGR